MIRKDEREIEVQLRTARQHEWAEFVESLDRNNPKLHLKAGLAEADPLEYCRLGAEIIAADEAGLPPNDATVRRFVELNRTVGQELRGDQH